MNLRIRFNQLPKNNITEFLKTIINKENIDISDENIKMIQDFYVSDIRSMINHIQTNENIENNVITNITWSKLIETAKETSKEKIIEVISEELDNISYKFNMEYKHIIKEFLNYIIRNKKKYITPEFLKFCEILMHIQEPNMKYYKSYFSINLQRVLLLPPENRSKSLAFQLLGGEHLLGSNVFNFKS